MVAVFNSPENGDSFVANEARTSDAPQFDLQTLYSDLSATTRGGNAGNRETGNQIDFGIDGNLYARANDSQSSSQGGFGIEQRSAMDIARRLATFDDDTNENNNNVSLDREDVGRLVEVYGDMYNARNSLQEGDKSEAEDWLGEMRRDLASFTKGLFGDSDSDQSSRERHGSREDEHDGDHRCPEAPGSDGKEGEHEEETGSENSSDEGTEESSEEGWENLEECESSDGHGDTGTEGYTPEDSMVLLMNDMQELSEALASGDTEAVQKIMARMNRHLALLMRQLNAQKGEGESDGEGAGQDPNHNPFADGWFGTGPVGGTRPIDERPDIFNPFSPELGLPNPSDILPTLPRLPNPGATLGGLPNPGDILGRLPQPPNPQDLLRNLPQPPNPNDLLRNLPSPGDLFDIF